MSAEEQALELLADEGFTDLKFTGSQVLRGEKLLTYTHADGEPVMDAPVVLVFPTGEVRLEPWTFLFKEVVS